MKQCRLCISDRGQHWQNLLCASGELYPFISSCAVSSQKVLAKKDMEFNANASVPEVQYIHT